MGKLQLSAELKLKIAETTGLTYLAYNLEKLDASESSYIKQVMEYYCVTDDALQVLNNTLIPEIKQQNPGFDSEVGPTPPASFKFILIAVPENAIIKLNGVEQSAITVEQGSEVSWEVSLDSYITQNGVVNVNEDTTKEIVLEPIVKIKPTLESNIPTVLEVGKSYEYDIISKANDFSGEMVTVKGLVSPSNACEMEYYEPKTSKFIPLKLTDGNFVFGAPSVGFPLGDAATKMRIKPLIAGEVRTKLAIVSVATDEALSLEYDSVITCNLVEEPSVDETSSNASQKIEEPIIDTTDAPADPAANAEPVPAKTTKK